MRNEITIIILLLTIISPLMGEEPVDMSERELLYQAVNSGSYEEIERALKEGYDINRRDAQGTTLFMTAVTAMDPRMVKMMLKESPDFDLLFGDPEASYSALSFLILNMYYKRNHDTTILKLLLRAGADPDGGENETGMPPLLRALSSNQSEAAELLIRYGADVNVKDGRTGLDALTLVVNIENEDDALKLLKQMLKKGLKLESLGTHVERAEANGHTRLAQLLRKEYER